MSMMQLDLQYLDECFIFNDGALYWRVRPRSHFATANAHSTSNSRCAGTKAGTINSHGYWGTKINGRIYQNHRLIWAMCHRAWPTDQIDHINGDRADNRLENLRVVTHSGNQRNRWLAQCNKSGVSGVYCRRDSGAWGAYIRDCGRRRHLGTFASKSDAIAARKTAELALGYSARHGERRP